MYCNFKKHTLFCSKCLNTRLGKKAYRHAEAFARWCKMTKYSGNVVVAVNFHNYKLTKHYNEIYGLRPMKEAKKHRIHCIGRVLLVCFFAALRTCICSLAFVYVAVYMLHAAVVGALCLHKID